MNLQTALLQQPAPIRRLLIGLALSLALHLALVLGFSPASVQFIAPQPLQVELRQVTEPQPAAELATPQPAELAAEPAAVAVPETAPQPLPHAPPVRESAINLDLPLDKYFTSRELDVRAEQINEVDLIYPLQAYQMRVRGKVVLRLFINERGGIDEIAIIEAEPPGIFEEAALNATLALRFKPAVKNGRDVKSQKAIEVVFNPYERINVP